MLAAVFGGLSLLTLWYVNFLRPHFKKRQLVNATDTYFLVPTKSQHDCSYARQDDDEHTLKELSLPPDTELIIDLIIRVKVPISYSEIIIGFFGDLDKKPYFTKYTNRYIISGKGQVVDPATEKDEDIIDKHKFYHRKITRSVSAHTVLSLAFTIKTGKAGLYPLHINFLSTEAIGENTNLFVTVESPSTLTLRCAEPHHKHLPCAMNGLRPS